MIKKEKRKLGIVEIMLIALVAAFAVGIMFMYLHEKLVSSGNEQVWNTIYSIFFQDITQPGAKGVGIFYLIGTIFMNGLRLSIVPLVFTSLILAMGSITDLKKLGRIAYKGVFSFLGMYIIGCIFAGLVALSAKNMGWIKASAAIDGSAGDVTLVQTANPLATIVSMVPDNMLRAMSSNNDVLAVVFLAIIIGICMVILGEKTHHLQVLLSEANEIIQLFIGFLINKIGPVAIFSLIVRAFALYGLEQIKPVLIYVIVTIIVLLVYLLIGYPLIIAASTKLNPVIFMKKMVKVCLIAFSTASSSPALPLNMKTNTEELGVSKEITNFVLPLGMTINMNGTSIMHVIGTIFIATVAGYDVGIVDVLLMSMLSILAAAGTPALPAAGTVLLFTVLNGMGYTNDMAVITYSLILAINKPVEMVLTSLNVMGDAAAAVMVASFEEELDTDIYYDRKTYVMAE